MEKHWYVIMNNQTLAIIYCGSSKPDSVPKGNSLYDGTADEIFQWIKVQLTRESGG